MKNELREKYDTFIYDSYKVEYNEQNILVTYTYKIKDYIFNPQVTIDRKNIINKSVNKEFLEYLFFNFGMINAINYYKLTCSKNILVNAGYLDGYQKEFFKKLFYNGLGEFRYVNNIELNYDEFVDLKTIEGNISPFDIKGQFKGNLIAVGGGKDSVVTLELLNDCKENNSCLLFNRNIYPVDQASLSCIKLADYDEADIMEFNLTLDPLMLELNKQGFLNGHIPFSSTLAFASYIMAYLSGKQYIVLSNESSANESNIKDSDINHQYSKSYEFEKDFREYTSKYFVSDIEYFSLLRCWNEYRIVKEFVKYPKYLEVFRSCNRGTKTNTWCGDCAKCLYVYIMLYNFVEQDKLISIFGHDMLNDLKYKDLFIGLISEQANKPFECVGSRDEINYALSNIVQRYETLPSLVQFYKGNFYDLKDDTIETYIDNNNFIPQIYRERMGLDRIEK